jgi:hypothetical protein
MKERIVFRTKVMRVADHKKLPNKNIVEIMLEKKIPKKYIRPIIFHEEIEDIFQRHFGLKYAEAHKLANKCEKELFFKGKKKEWHDEISEVSRLYEENHKCKKAILTKK